MYNVLNALAELPKLNRRAAEFCEESDEFREYLRSSASVGEVCSFVNLVKFILEKQLKIAVDDQFIRRFNGLYRLSLEVIIDPQRRRFGRYMDDLENIQGVLFRKCRPK